MSDAGRRAWAGRVRAAMKAKDLTIEAVAKATATKGARKKYSVSYISNALNLYKPPSEALNAAVCGVLELDAKETWALLTSPPAAWAGLSGELLPDEEEAVKRFAEALLKARRLDELVKTLTPTG